MQLFFSFFGYRTFLPSCFSKMSSRTSWSKSSQDSQWNRREGASTLPRTKPKTYCSATLSAKPRISIFPAQKPNSSPTHSTLKPKPSHSLHLPASDLTDPLLHCPRSPPAVSSTLTIPAPRLSPSPTSLCEGITLESPGFRQASPVAKDRCVRSISISNTKGDPVSSKVISSNEAKHDLLDQDHASTDFSHPVWRRVGSAACHESPRQTYSDSQRQATRTSFSSQEKNSSIRRENSDRDKPKPPPRNTDISAILKPNPNIKQQQEWLPSGATSKQTSLSKTEGITFSNVAQRKSQLPFDRLPIHSGLNLHRKCTDYSQSRMEGLGSNERSHEPTWAERRAALPDIPTASFSKDSSLNQSTAFSNMETRRKCGFNNDAKEDTTLLLGSNLESPLAEKNSSRLFEHTLTPESAESPQKHRSWRKALSPNPQMDMRGAVSLSDCGLGNYSCHSKDTDEEKVDPHRTRRLNQLNTCLVAPHTWRANCPSPLKSDVETNKQPLARVKHPGQNKGHAEFDLCDTAVNQTAGVPTELPEHPSEKCVGSWPPSATQWPLHTDSSKGACDPLHQPQYRLYHRPDETTMGTSTPQHPPNQPPTDTAFITEEDPYYVTMYYPGSVYVGKYKEDDLLN